MRNGTGRTRQGMASTIRLWPALVFRAAGRRLRSSFHLRLGHLISAKEVTRSVAKSRERQSTYLFSAPKPWPVRDLFRAQPDVSPTIDKACATVQSMFAPTLSENTPLWVAQPDTLCVAPGRRVRGCARFG